MRESRHRRDRFSDKNSQFQLTVCFRLFFKKDETFFGVSEISFSKVARASRFQWGKNEI